MPNVNDIATIAEALERQPVLVLKDRCVAVRNRNATCRACVQACPFNALDVSANEVNYNALDCVGCGACVAACPTEALVSTVAPDAALAEAASNANRNAEGLAVVACARISSKRLADPEKYAEVPCLARIDEALLVELAAHAETVVAVDGNCQTCKYRDCVAGVDETLFQAHLLVEASGGSCDIQRRSAFPDEILVEDATGRFGSTRRGFFSEAVGAAKETAMTAAQATLEQELGIKVHEAAIGERLRVTSSGALPTIAVPRHERLLNAFDALGEPEGERLESRRFACLSINAEKCNSCGMCAVFCPTGALKRDEAEKASDPIKYIEFSAAECINCGLCKDVCWKEALELEQGVSIEQLYDFEPRRFDLPRAQMKSSFGSW